MSAHALRVEALTPEAFAPFGDLIVAEAARTRYPVNGGTATRYHDLAQVDTARDGGRTVISLFRAEPRALPFELGAIERHPLGSQAFVALGGARFIVVVASDPAATPRAFLAEGVGINYRPGTWHHPLIALDRSSDFLVVDRAGPGTNCDEAALAERYAIVSL